MKPNLIMYRTWFILFSILTFSAQSQVTERYKKVVKSFKALPETSVQVTNKYGNIHIVPGPTDSIRFEIEIKVSDKKEEKADILLNNIHIQFNDSPYYIIGKTVFTDFKGSSWSYLSDKASTSISGGDKVEINWVIYIPEKNELKIENKFGNVYTTNHSGLVNFDISNGDLQANAFTGETKIKVEFGDIRLKSFTNAKLEVSYSEVEFKKANKIDILSRSSKINIPVVDELNLDSKHDKYYIDSVHVMRGEATFSNFKVGIAGKDVILKLKYGNCNFESLSNNIRYFNIISSYTDVTVMLLEDFAAKFSLNYRKATLSLPDYINAFPKELANPETQEFKTTGIIGNEKPEMPELKLSISSGTITIGKK